MTEKCALIVIAIALLGLGFVHAATATTLPEGFRNLSAGLGIGVLLTGYARIFPMFSALRREKDAANQKEGVR